MIEKGHAGRQLRRTGRKLGWHSQPTAQLMLDGVRVPVANRLGAKATASRYDGGSGWRAPGYRRLLARRCTASARWETITYVRTAKAVPAKAIAEFQNTQFTLADMATELEAAALLYLATVKVTESASDKTLCRNGQTFRLDTSSAVVDRTAIAWRLWLSDGLPDQNASGAICASTASEGTNEVMKMIVGRDLLK